MILQFLIVITVSWITYFLQRQLYWSAIRASSSVTLMFSGGFYLLHLIFDFDLDMYLKLTFGATFVGMCSPFKFNYDHILLSSFIYVIIFSFLLPYLPYAGGALGFIALSSVLMSNQIKMVQSR